MKWPRLFTHRKNPFQPTVGTNEDIKMIWVQYVHIMFPENTHGN